MMEVIVLTMVAIASAVVILKTAEQEDTDAK